MAQTEAERQAKRDEELANDFGRDPEGTRKRFERTRTVRERAPGITGIGRIDEAQFTTRQEKYIRGRDQKRLDQAAADLRARGGSTTTAEAQSRGVAGGSFVSTGDFGPGAIRLNTVTPVNSKVGGR